MLDKKLENRLKRVAGQLHKIQEDIQNDKDCAEVITQFMAVKGALGGAFEEYVRLSLDSCAKNDEEKIKKLISILVKS
jgi:DNA-binding FrmR family transcriptional regulator